MSPARRRGVDDWAHIQVGDIISFDSRSPNCPSGGFVERVETRDDGKRVLLLGGSSIPVVTEHVSYRMRIEERTVSMRMQQPGGPLSWGERAPSLSEFWSVSALYDYSGRAPAMIKVETYKPVRVFGRLRWNVLRGRDLRDDTALLYEARSAQPGPGWDAGGFTLPGDRRAWRRYDPTIRALVPIPVEEVNCHDISPIGPIMNPYAFDDLDASAETTSKLNEVTAWIYDHRYELDDPGQPRRS